MYEYASNEQDLLRVKQKNGSDYDLLRELTYDSSHQPLTTKDAAAQTTTFTYNSEGQILTIVTPARAGITENRTTTYDYDEDGYLESVTGPATGTTTGYTYDSYGRTRTVTDSDGYVLTYDYDALDRQTKVTYPDATYKETTYVRLDAVRARDRLGRWTQRVHDALQRTIATTDPLGRTVTQQWCSCGTLEVVTDANGNKTAWERDIQGRVTKEIRANASEWLFGYETTTSRLKNITDPKEQVKTYAYFADDNLSEVTYTNEEHTTPNVSYTFEAAYDRIATMVDGTGTTTYDYHPIGQSPGLGAGRLASVDGSFADDTISYAYDELGRIAGRAVNGVTFAHEYDALGRMTTETNVLGFFSYQYDGVTSRLKTVTYPNGQTSTYLYYASNGDHRVKEIHHQKSGGSTISKFTYGYDAVGNITTWTQQQDASAPKAYDFEYDGADQLRSAVWRTTDPTPTTLKRYGYAYDPAGNRTLEQIDDAPVLSAYDNMNRITNQAPGGAMRFAGTLDEAATVTVEGLAAVVSADNSFVGSAPVSSGTNSVVVKAKDYSGNERTNTYEISVSGTSTSVTFDANGNVTDDGTQTFEWDAENRLIAVKQGANTIASFSYNGNGSRATKTTSSGTASYVYDGQHVIEERGPGGVARYVFGEGVDNILGKKVGTDTFFYTKDHIGSIREVTNAAGAVSVRRDYDPWGNLLQSGGTSGYAFTGREWDSEIGLYFYRARYYDPSLGVFLGEDPIRTFQESMYRYVESNPVRYVDPSGQQAEECCDESKVKSAAQQICDRSSEIKDVGMRKCLDKSCPLNARCASKEECNEEAQKGGYRSIKGFASKGGPINVCGPQSECELYRTIFHEAQHVCNGPSPRGPAHDMVESRAATNAARMFPQCPVPR